MLIEYIKYFNLNNFLTELPGRYYIGLWALNCPCKDDLSDKVCNCVSCKSEDDKGEALKSKQMFESLIWKPDCSKIFILYL